MLKYSDVINGSKINLLVMNIKLQSECLLVFFFRMVRANEAGFHNVASKEEGGLLSCLFSLAFKISFSAFICMVTLPRGARQQQCYQVCKISRYRVLNALKRNE